VSSQRFVFDRHHWSTILCVYKEYVCKHMVEIYVKTRSSIINNHGRTSSKTCSNIVRNHDQQSLKHMVNNHQNTWSTIIKQHGQQSSKTMVKHRYLIDIIINVILNIIILIIIINIIIIIINIINGGLSSRTVTIKLLEVALDA
jgi:hypothetical protein